MYPKREHSSDKKQPSEHIAPSATPFLKVILPAAIGITLAWWVDLPWQAVGVCFMVSFGASIWLSRSVYGNIYLWLSIVLFFFTIAEMRTPKGELPQGERIVVVAQITEKPHIAGRWQRTTADVGYYVSAGDYPLGDDREWRSVDERIMLSVDTCYRDIEVGSQLVLRGWFNAIDTTESGYGRLMRLRGLHGRMYVVDGNLLHRLDYVSRTPVYYASKLQQAAINKLNRLTMESNAKAVTTAMTAGDRRGVGRELTAAYGKTGATHLLAVSGLNVGIVFVLVNILLYLLPAVRRGHIVKNVAAIVAIWLYSAIAGLEPSVVRAALMFSFAQVALATTSSRSALNIMLGSAIVMLAINPNYATDPSFLLSYVAVLSILLFFGPIYRALKTRYKVVNAFTSALIVGVVATLGTAPLVSFWFGNFPIVGVLINLPMIFTAYIIVMLGVLWLMMPFGFLQPVFSWMLGVASGAQNGIVEWAAGLSWASKSVSLPLWGVVAVYTVYVALAVWVYRRDGTEKKRVILR